MTTQDVLGWLIASSIGFVAGYVVCYSIRRAVEVEATSSRAERRGVILRNIFGVVLLVLAIATFTQSYAVDQCTARAINARSEAQGEATRAQTAWLGSLLTNPPPAREESIRLTVEYVEALRRLEETRVNNPIDCTGLFPFDIR